MKIKYIAFLIALLFGASCSKEPAITPSSTEGSDRFSFPQGNSDYDQVAKNVFEKFGVKIIYKDFTEADFNLSWTAPGIGKIGYPVPEVQQGEAVNYIANDIFGNLTPNIIKRVLPPFFYVADSVYQITNVAGLLEGRNPTAYNYTGLDFWQFTWNGIGSYTKNLATGLMMAESKPIERPKTSFQKFYRRGVMLKEIYKKAVTVGNIKAPEGFSAGLDFTKAIKYAVGTDNDPDHFRKRGFPGQMTSTTTFELGNLTAISKTNPDQNFIDYIHLCMRYSPDTLEIAFPKANYPILHEKYKIAIDYMKEKYAIDLTKIATKPE